MIKAVLFDLDNTLIDFIKTKKKCCAAAVEAMREAGLKMDRKEALDILFGLYEKHGLEYKHIFEEFTKKLKGKVDYRLVAEGIIAYRKRQESYMRPYRDVVPTLIRLRERGLKLAIVSDAPAMKAWLRLTENGLYHFFDTVVTLTDTGEIKPSKKPFKLALKRLKIKPEEALFVGDVPQRDIRGAQNMGMKTAFAAYGSEYTKSKSDFHLKRFKDILKVV